VDASGLGRRPAGRGLVASWRPAAYCQVRWAAAQERIACFLHLPSPPRMINVFSLRFALLCRIGSPLLSGHRFAELLPSVGPAAAELRAPSHRDGHRRRPLTALFRRGCSLARSGRLALPNKAMKLTGRTGQLAGRSAAGRRAEDAVDASGLGRRPAGRGLGGTLAAGSLLPVRWPDRACP
jgi:hypothetical protein